MRDDGERPAVMVDNAGAVAVGGNVELTASLLAGRDLVVNNPLVLVDDGPPFGDAATRPGRPADICPYPGAVAFESRYRDYFQGRDRDRDTVIDLVEKRHLTAVVGSSGSGKSSLLAAGVVPALKERPDGGRLSIVQMRPGTRPVDQLVAGAGSILPDITAEAIRADPHRLAELMRRAGRALLVVVDQFEEVFDPSVTDGDRTAFVAALTAMTQDATGRVLLALRSDYYPHLDVSRELADAVAASQHRLPPLTRQAIRDAVVLPAERVGLRVEPELVDQILRDTDPGPNVLPLLASALRETWRRRRNGWLTLSGYVQAGGVSRALEQSADDAWTRLSEDQRPIARRVFLRLVHVGDGTAPVRRRVPVRSLLTEADTARAVASVVEELTRGRLLTLDSDAASGEQMVDVIHESLLREWGLLRSWLADDLEGKRIQDDLTMCTLAWTKHGNDPAYLFSGVRLAAVDAYRRRSRVTVNDAERRFLAASHRMAGRQQWRTRLLAILPVALAVTLVIVGVTVVQRQRTEDAKTLSDALSLAAQSRATAGNQRDLAALLALAGLTTRAVPETISAVVDVVASPDGPGAYPSTDGIHANTLAPTLAGEHAAVGLADGTVRFVSAVTGRPVGAPLIGHTAPVTTVAIAGDLVVSGSATGEVLVHRGRQSDPVITLDGGQSAIRSVHLDDRHDILVAVTAAGTVHRWRLPVPTTLPPITVHSGLATAVVQGGHVVAATLDGAVRRWNIETGAEATPLAGDGTLRNGDAVRLAVTPDGALAVLDGARIGVWPADGHDHPLRTTGTLGTALGTTTTGILVGTPTGAINTWTPQLQATAAVPRGLVATITSIAVDGARLMALDDTGKLAAWDLAAGRSPASTYVDREPNATQAVAYNADGVLASGGADGQVRLSAPGEATTTLKRYDSAVVGLAWLTPTTLVVASRDGSVHTITTDTHSETMISTPTGSPVVDVRSTRTGTLVIGWADGQIRVGASVHRTRAITALAVAPEGDLLATASGVGSDAEILLFRTSEPGAAVGRLRGHQHRVASLAFSPDGETLASGSEDHSIRLWAVADGRSVAHMQGHSDMVRALVFTPDGSLLASSSEDGGIRLWDAAGHRQVGQPLVAEAGFVTALAASADGRMLAAANTDTVVVWPFSVAAWRDKACALANRDLSAAEWSRHAPTRQRRTLCRPPA